eukprot:149574_1
MAENIPNYFCAYCAIKNVSLRRCSGCQIIFYCSKLCQKEHWHLIHKSCCKKWKKMKNLSNEQKSQLHTKSLLTLTKLSESYGGNFQKNFKKMTKMMTINKQKHTSKELLFDIDDDAINFRVDSVQNEDDLSPLMLFNEIMNILISAFDRDKDGKLNLKEWQLMIKDLGLSGSYYSSKEFFFDVCHDIGLLEWYKPSLNSGSYGSFIYPNSSNQHNFELLLGPKHIFEAFKIIAWCKSVDENNEDDDFPEFDPNDERMRTQKALRLLHKVCGHAQEQLWWEEAYPEDIYAAILDAVPYLNDDIISVIYNYATCIGLNIFKISWHTIRWKDIGSDLPEFYALYKTHQSYDVSYLSKQDEAGNDDISLNVDICDDRADCNRKLELIKDESAFGYNLIEMLDRRKPKKRWCLGLCPSYIPNYSFSLKDHAKLIGKVLEFHKLDPVLCHYIYVGVGVRCDRKEKSQVVDAFNEIYKAHAVFRSHKPKLTTNPFSNTY